MAIPYYSMDLNRQELSSIIKLLLTQKALEGGYLQQFERLIADVLGVKHVLLFPSGRSAFYFLMKDLFDQGDEVIVSIYSFPLFIRLFHEQGIRPVFVDVDDRGLINVDLIEEKITPRTKGILVTHLFGNACAMKKIADMCLRHHLHLIEDCAHAFGATYYGKPLGTFGQAGIFSTSPMKVPTTLGGGFLVTDDERLYQRISQKLLSSAQNQYSYNKLLKLFAFTLVYYWNSFPFIFSILTSRMFQYMNAKNPGKLRQLFYSELVTKKPFDPFERIRLTNLQAAVGISQIARTNAMMEIRRKYAQIYDRYFEGTAIEPIREQEGSFNNFLYYIIRLPSETTSFIDAAMKRGLFLMREEVWYCNRYSFSQNYAQECPLGQQLAPLLVRLPNSSLLKESTIQRVAEIVKELISEQQGLNAEIIQHPVSRNV